MTSAFLTLIPGSKDTVGPAVFRSVDSYVFMMRYSGSAYWRELVEGLTTERFGL